MRIILVNRFYYPNLFGGATMVVDDLANELVRKGHTVLVFTGHTDSLISKTDKVYRYNHNLIEVISIRLDRINHQTEFDNPDVEEYFEKVISAFKPDIVNAHAIQGLGVGVLRAANNANIPVHISMHDSWFVCDRQFLVNHQDKYCEQKIINLDICRFCSKDPGFLDKRKAISLELIDKAESVISPSKWFSEFLKVNLDNSEKILTVPNGTARPLHVNRPDPHIRKEVVFGFLGGIGQVKGSDVLFAALSELLKLDFKLVLVNNTGLLGRRLDLSFIPSGLSDKIVIRKPFTRNEMDEFYQEIDCLIFPSQTMETFGLSVREALIREKWVITSQCGGVDDAVIEGVNGNLVPMGYGGLESWISAIRTYIEERPASKGNMMISTPEHQAEQMLQIFHKSLESKN